MNVPLLLVAAFMRTTTRLADRLAAGIAAFARTLLLLAFIGASGTAFAVAPPAGTVIGNTATATYNDSLGTARTATSNTVQTTVQQVGSVTIVAAQAKLAVPGSTVYYPQTLTNAGNGSDTFALATTNGGTFTMSSVAIYADNGSGLPTGSPITTTGALAAGATFKFVIAAVMPGIVVATTNTITATATSTFDATKTGSVSDVTTVTLDAVIGLTKSVSAASGGPGSGPYTYTLSYTNSGAFGATAIKIVDTLPAGLVYVAGSARWSATGATALTDATGDTQGTVPTIDYSVTGQTITANISQELAGVTQTLTFQATVAAGQPPGVLNNTASLQYVNSLGATQTGSSNTVPFTVTTAAGVTVTAPSVTASALPGATLTFTNSVKNTGNASDTINVAYANATTNGFPAGTTFALFKADGVTPLTDTNADGTVDLGPLAAGATTSFILKATLPAGISGGPFNVNTTVTSSLDATKTATATDTITGVGAATVDLTAGTGLGVGTGPEASPVTTVTVSPGGTTVLPIVVNNTSLNTDSYDLAASTASNFATTSLPSGWTVVFKADNSTNCTSLGATVTNTGTIAAGGTTRVCAVVTVPATGSGAVAGNTDIYLRGTSSVTGATDILHDRVTVNGVRSLTLAPVGTGQIIGGGSVVYAHTLTNTGNSIEGNGTTSTVTFGSGDTKAGFTSVQYFDADNSGTLTAGDVLIPAGGLAAIPALAAGLAPGQSITILDKVTAPAGAVIGDIDVTTVTVTTVNGSGVGSAPTAVATTDSSTVVVGSSIALVKEQTLDVNCNGTIGAWTQAALSAGAVPNACIRYRITATNIGTATASAVVVSDTTPTFTLYDTGGGAGPAVTSVGTITAPANGVAGTVTATIGTLAPAASAVITFGVRIQP